MTRIGTALLTALLSLALCATAAAKSVQLTGGIEGDDNAKLTLKVKVDKKGKLKKVKKLTYSNVDVFAIDEFGDATGALCGEQSGTFSKWRELGQSDTLYQTDSIVEEGGRLRQAMVTVRYPKPKSATGAVQFEQPNGDYCKSRDFTLKR